MIPFRAITILDDERYKHPEDPVLFEAYTKAIRALDKQIPRTPILWKNGYVGNEILYMWKCPECGRNYELVEGEQYDYCIYCGQAIDWFR